MDLSNCACTYIRSDKRRHNLYCCFVDLKSAYDKVPHRPLWQMLRSLGVWGRTLAPCSPFTSTVKWQSMSRVTVGASIRTRIGLRQGFDIVPMLDEAAILTALTAQQDYSGLMSLIAQGAAHQLGSRDVLVHEAFQLPG
jgi:hypothetical protein